MNLRKDHYSIKLVLLSIFYSTTVFVVDFGMEVVILKFLFIELITMDILALESMKNAAKCDK